VLTRRHSYDLSSASVDKRIPTADKPVGERKFNGEPSWCYPTGPAGIWTGLECGSGVRYAGTSSRDGHRRDRRAHQRRRRRRYRRASRHYQWDSCPVHGRGLRTGAPAELQPPGAKVNSSLNWRPRRPAGNSCDIFPTAPLIPPERSVASRRALGVRNITSYFRWVEPKLRKTDGISQAYLGFAQSDRWSGSYRPPLIRSQSLRNRLDLGRCLSASARQAMPQAFAVPRQRGQVVWLDGISAVLSLRGQVDRCATSCRPRS